MWGLTATPPTRRCAGATSKSGAKAAALADYAGDLGVGARLRIPMRMHRGIEQFNRGAANAGIVPQIEDRRAYRVGQADHGAGVSLPNFASKPEVRRRRDCPTSCGARRSRAPTTQTSSGDGDRSGGRRDPRPALRVPRREVPAVPVGAVAQLSGPRAGTAGTHRPPCGVPDGTPACGHGHR